MLKSKRANILVAVLAAIAMWAYVTGTVDPTITKKVAAVPITVINEDSLLQEGLAVESVDTLTVDLTLEGSRADMSGIKTDDIVVTADLYGRNKGVNSISLDFELPKGIKVESRSVEKIRVEIDNVISHDYKVQVDVKGALSENTVLGYTQVTPEYVTVYGTEGNLNKISKVMAVIEAEKLSEQNSTQQAELVVRDSNGREIPFVKAGTESVEVLAHIDKMKEVPLKVKTSGQLKDGLLLDSVDAAQTIAVQGSESVLNGITEIETEEIDLSEISGTVSLMVDLKLPEGVDTADGTNKAEVKIVLTKTESKTLQYKGSEATLLNLGDELTAEVSDIEVTVSGTADVLDRITEGNTKITLDLEGLEEGTHQVEVTVKSEIEGVAEAKFDGGTVEVEIIRGEING